MYIQGTLDPQNPLLMEKFANWLELKTLHQMAR